MREAETGILGRDNVKTMVNVPGLSNAHTTGDHGKSDATKLRAPSVLFTGEQMTTGTMLLRLKNNQVFSDICQNVNPAR